MFEGTGVLVSKVKQLILNKKKELNSIGKTFVEGLSNYTIRQHERTSLPSRNHDIHIVLGSSGSGKTTFATQVLADKHFDDECAKQFTVYNAVAGDFKEDTLKRRGRMWRCFRRGESSFEEEAWHGVPSHPVSV